MGLLGFLKDNKDSIKSGLALGSFGLGLLETVKGFKQQDLINKQVAYQNKLAREAFDWSKYSQENKYQISALDAQKAGINPLAMTGVGMSSLSASSGFSIFQFSGNSPGFSPLACRTEPVPPSKNKTCFPR